jgi:septum formation protein
METIILASGSPRRQELLNRVRIPFKAFPPNITEPLDLVGSIPGQVTEIARRKIDTVVGLFKQESPRWVLGLDTLVEVNGTPIPKPANPEEAEKVLRLLSGRVHRVHTGIGFLPSRGKKLDLRCVTTEVKFITLSDGDIEYYLLTGEWSGVAGGYRIQERGAFFVEWIKGSHSNVVGLPLETFYGILKDNRYSF